MRPARRKRPERPFCRAVWRAAVPSGADSPARAYLTARLGSFAGHPAVRWLTSGAAARVKLRPKLPSGAAGALCYLFAAPDDAAGASVRRVALRGSARSKRGV